MSVCCTIETQQSATGNFLFSVRSLSGTGAFTAQPLLERVNLEPYLDGVELVVVGGESDRNARSLDYDWVLDLRAQCIRKNVSFEFRQCCTHFIKDGRRYTLQTRDLVPPGAPCRHQLHPKASVRKHATPDQMNIPNTLTVNETQYTLVRLLGKGKGGYSYLVTDGRAAIRSQADSPRTVQLLRLRRQAASRAARL